MAAINTLIDLKKELNNNTDLQNQFKEDPVKATQNLVEKGASVPDNWIYRIVVGSLGLAVLLVIIGTIILNPGNDQNLPTVFTAIASGAIGALAGLLAPSPAR